MTIGQLLRTRRWLGLTLLAGVLVLAFAGLGRWQLSRSYRVPDGFSTEPLAVPLDVLDPGPGVVPARYVGRQATASGQYDATGQVLVPGHVLDGSAVLWVVTPLRLPDGSAVEVVRGWVSASEGALDAAPVGTVQVTGRLQPGVVGSGALTAVPATSADVRPGYLVRTAQSPPDPLSLQPVPSKPLSSGAGAKEFHLQNALYTSQWWIFAVLVVAYWWRLLRDEHVLRASPAA
jgi:cytochrome oxidase assembly protein ShyY1